MQVKVADKDEQRVDQTCTYVAEGTLQIANLGSGQRNGRPQTLHPGDRYPGLLLRPTAPLAAQFEREHQPLAEAAFPKDTELSVHSQAKLDDVARELNGRPRKTLNFETPPQRFHQYIATTGRIRR
jgi:hypothetical protein